MESINVRSPDVLLLNSPAYKPDRDCHHSPGGQRNDCNNWEHRKTTARLLTRRLRKRLLILSPVNHRHRRSVNYLDFLVMEKPSLNHRLANVRCRLCEESPKQFERQSESRFTIRSCLAAAGHSFSHSASAAPGGGLLATVSGGRRPAR